MRPCLDLVTVILSDLPGPAAQCSRSSQLISFFTCFQNHLPVKEVYLIGVERLEAASQKDMDEDGAVNEALIYLSKLSRNKCFAPKLNASAKSAKPTQLPASRGVLKSLSHSELSLLHRVVCPVWDRMKDSLLQKWPSRLPSCLRCRLDALTTVRATVAWLQPPVPDPEAGGTKSSVYLQR